MYTFQTFIGTVVLVCCMYYYSHANWWTRFNNIC